jgi:CDP-diacylglycerol--glycerol-3-phosphate 3-phosphatidyltransferase
MPINLPNSITIVRIALVPLFIWMLFALDSANAWARWATVAAFIALIVTDSIDGQIARRRNLITNLGKLLDPIADKVLLGGALISLSLLGRIDWWITILILIREFGITIYRLLVANRKVLAASSSGKVKTVLQSVAIGFYLSPLADLLTPVATIQAVILYAALISTLASGVQYLNAERKAK